MARMAAVPPLYFDCAHCGKPIERPEPNSYPPDVEWVHAWSPVGQRNRYCDFGSATATPSTPEGD